MKRLAFWISAFLMWSGVSHAQFHGSHIAGSSLGQQWTAIDVYQQIKSPQVMQGKITLYFFGFTQCPDVCPTTLLSLSDMFSLLNEQEQEQVRVVMVSVDPERDTTEILKHYLASFNPHFEGLTGMPEQIKQFAKSFKVFYRKVPMANGSYTMEHSANLFLFDKKGNAKLFYYGDVSPESLASDIKTLLTQEN